MSKQCVQERAQEGVEETTPMKYDRRDKVCEICGKRVKAQGYGGHLFLVHDVKTGVVARLEEVTARVQALEKGGNPGPASGSDGDPGPHAAARVASREHQPFSSAVDELGGQLKTAQEEIGGLENRVEIMEAFFRRIFGEKGDKWYTAEDVTLRMSPKDWEKTEEERAAQETKEKGEEEEDEEEGEEEEN